MSALVIFGSGSLAEVTRFYFEKDSPYDVVAFTVDDEYADSDTCDGLPLVPFSELEDHYPSSDHHMFVAVGYRRVNQIRARVFGEVKKKGYRCASYLSSKSTHWDDTVIGENTFIFEDNTIQPFVRIGDNSILWSGNHIGHHATIGSHCFITSQVVVSGHVRIGDYCFVGVNSTIRDDIEIADRCVIGAGAIIMKSTKEAEVYVAQRTMPHDKSSDAINL